MITEEKADSGVSTAEDSGTFTSCVVFGAATPFIAARDAGTLRLLLTRFFTTMNIITSLGGINVKLG